MNDSMIEVETVDLTLVIDNIYEDGTEIQTNVRTTVEVPPRPVEVGPQGVDYDDDEFNDWEQDEIFRHAGANYPEGGDAGYFVEVTESSRPDLIPVGAQFEFC